MEAAPGCLNAGCAPSLTPADARRCGSSRRATIRYVRPSHPGASSMTRTSPPASRSGRRELHFRPRAAPVIFLALLITLGIHSVHAQTNDLSADAATQLKVLLDEDL